MHDLKVWWDVLRVVVPNCLESLIKVIGRQPQADAIVLGAFVTVSVVSSWMLVKTLRLLVASRERR